MAPIPEGTFFFTFLIWPLQSSLSSMVTPSDSVVLAICLTQKTFLYTQLVTQALQACVHRCGQEPIKFDWLLLRAREVMSLVLRATILEGRIQFIESLNQ